MADKTVTLRILRAVTDHGRTFYPSPKSRNVSEKRAERMLRHRAADGEPVAEEVEVRESVARRPPDPPPRASEPHGYEAYNVPQLEDYARENGYALNGARRRADIIAAIEEARASAEVSETSEEESEAEISHAED